MECTRTWLRNLFRGNNCLRGDNYITKKVRIDSLALLILQTLWELWPAQYFHFSGDNKLTKKVKVVALASDTPTGPPLLFYQILSKYVEWYQSYGAYKDEITTINGNNYITKKMRIVSLACDTPTGPLVHPCQIF